MQVAAVKQDVSALRWATRALRADREVFETAMDHQSPDWRGRPSPRRVAPRPAAPRAASPPAGGAASPPADGPDAPSPPRREFPEPLSPVGVGGALLPEPLSPVGVGGALLTQVDLS